MIDKADILRLSEPIEDVYAEIVDRLIVAICTRLGKGKALATARWETYMLDQLGALTRECASIINDAVKGIPQEIQDALTEAARESLRDIEKLLEEAAERGYLQREGADAVLGVLRDLSRQAVDQMNLVNTVMLQSSQTAFTQAVQRTVIWSERELTAAGENVVLRALNTATASAATGAESRRVALRRAIAQLAENGIYGFVDRAGRHWSPEAYVNMDMVTTIHNASIEAVRARQQEYGSNIFQISAHAGARPLCYPYQRWICSWERESGVFVDGRGVAHPYRSIYDTSYGQPAGIFGINCGHFAQPQIAGMTIPQDESVEPEPENNRRYLESQEQRRLERSIRAAKRKQAAFRAAGDEEAAADMGTTIRARQAAMRDFIRRTGRTREYEREQIA